MKNAVMPLEQAVNEINGWLDYKRIDQSDRKKYAEAIDKLAENVAYGDLSIAEDKTMTFKLAFPIEVASVPVEAITIKGRLTAKEVKDKTLKVKAGDGDGRLLAYLEAATGQQEQVLEKLDTKDFNVLNNIALFFMV
jgi:hypothetical protein